MCLSKELTEGKVGYEKILKKREEILTVTSTRQMRSRKKKQLTHVA